MPETRQLVEARTLKGTQDLLPEDAIPRRAVLAKIENIFQKFGFVPIETPALEHLDVLLGTGGEETNKELFRLESPEEEPIALRFDLTVPFSRVLAQYPDRIKPPFRRYAIGPVWRADKPGPGRFRQFTQVDIDAAGSASPAVDAEIVSIMAEVMIAVGVTDFCVSVNNRKIIDALLIGAGIEDVQKQKHVLRVIDKLQKVGIENVRRELGPGRIDASGDPIPGVHLPEAAIEAVCAFVGISGGTRKEIVEKLRSSLPASEATESALKEMTELDDALGALGAGEQHVRFDPSLARGLDYYTGPVFETVITSAPQFGSVMGGGRYDGLVERFLDKPIPCTGMSVGLDRLMAALSHLGLVSKPKSTVQALIVSMGNVPAAEALKIAAELRSAGICAEAFFGMKRNLKTQLSHADHYEIPVAVIVGEDEIAAGTVSIKALIEGKQQRENIADREAYRQAGKTAQVTVARSAMVETVRGMLA
jgi:histidyl-tRNA synthetase